jgi:hypothetical protein
MAQAAHVQGPLSLTVQLSPSKQETRVQTQAESSNTLEASVATTFDVLAWEIELAGARCIQLDKLIGDLLPELPPPQREKLLEGLHTVDLLSQHLTNLSAFSRHMGENAPEHMVATVHGALGEITLGALADRMRESLGGAEGEDSGHDAGDFDFF